jgi:hypothetical protein
MVIPTRNRREHGYCGRRFDAAEDPEHRRACRIAPERRPAACAGRRCDDGRVHAAAAGQHIDEKQWNGKCRSHYPSIG